MAEKITMTASEVDTHIRTIDRRCRGPRLSSVPDALAEYADFRKAYGREPMSTEYMDQLAALPDLGAIVGDMLACGAEEDARFVDELREPCGADLNETILATPHDGREHTYTCPSCGLTGVFRAMKVTVVPDPEPAPAGG